MSGSYFLLTYGTLSLIIFRLLYFCSVESAVNFIFTNSKKNFLFSMAGFQYFFLLLDFISFTVINFDLFSLHLFCLEFIVLDWICHFMVFIFFSLEVLTTISSNIASSPFCSFFGGFSYTYIRPLYHAHISLALDFPPPHTHTSSVVFILSSVYTSIYIFSSYLTYISLIWIHLSLQIPLKPTCQ